MTTTPVRVSTFKLDDTTMEAVRIPFLDEFKFREYGHYEDHLQLIAAWSEGEVVFSGGANDIQPKIYIEDKEGVPWAVYPGQWIVRADGSLRMFTQERLDLCQLVGAE